MHGIQMLVIWKTIIIHAQNVFLKAGYEHDQISRLLTLSSGCVIKNGHICGPQTPKIVQAFFEASNQIDSNRKFVFIL